MFCGGMISRELNGKEPLLCMGFPYGYGDFTGVDRKGIPIEFILTILLSISQPIKSYRLLSKANQVEVFCQIDRQAKNLNELAW